jgi:hypothetical protein
LTEAEKEALAKEAERKKKAAEGGMGMMPFLVIILAFVAFVYAKNNEMI